MGFLSRGKEIEQHFAKSVNSQEEKQADAVSSHQQSVSMIEQHSTPPNSAIHSQHNNVRKETDEVAKSVNLQEAKQETLPRHEFYRRVRMTKLTDMSEQSKQIIERIESHARVYNAYLIDFTESDQGYKQAVLKFNNPENYENYEKYTRYFQIQPWQYEEKNKLLLTMSHRQTATLATSTFYIDGQCPAANQIEKQELADAATAFASLNNKFSSTLAKGDMVQCKVILDLLTFQKIPLAAIVSINSAKESPHYGKTPLFIASYNFLSSNSPIKEIFRGIIVGILGQLGKHNDSKLLSDREQQRSNAGASWFINVLTSKDMQLYNYILDLLKERKLPLDILLSACQGATPLYMLFHPLNPYSMGSQYEPEYILNEYTGNYEIVNNKSFKLPSDATLCANFARELINQLSEHRHKKFFAGIVKQNETHQMSWFMHALIYARVYHDQIMLKIIKDLLKQRKIPIDVMTSEFSWDGHCFDRYTPLVYAIKNCMSDDSDELNIDYKEIAINLLDQLREFNNGNLFYGMFKEGKFTGEIWLKDASNYHDTDINKRIFNLVEHKLIPPWIPTSVIQEMISTKITDMRAKTKRGVQEAFNIQEITEPASQVTQSLVNDKLESKQTQSQAISLELDFEKENLSEQIQKLVNNKIPLSVLSFKNFDSHQHLKMIIEHFEKTSLEVVILSLSDCHIIPEFYYKIIHGILSNNCIKIVSIKNCSFEKQSLRKISGLIGKSSLTIELLQLSGCDISKNGDLNQVCRIIRQNSFLGQINLENCKITQDGMMVLLHAIEERYFKSGSDFKELDINVKGNDFKIEDWEAHYKKLLTKCQSSQHVPSNTPVCTVAPVLNEEKISTKKESQETRTNEYQQYYYSGTSKQRNPRRTGPRIHQGVTSQPEGENQPRKNKKRHKPKQKTKSNKSISLRLSQQSQPKTSASVEPVRRKQSWDPCDEPPGGGRVYIHPRLKDANETDHLPKRSPEQKKEVSEDNIKVQLILRNGLFARTTLDNVDAINRFERLHIQPLKQILDLKAESDNMKIMKKYALCWQVASLGQAAGEKQYAGNFDETTGKILRHVRLVFFKCFLEIERFNLEQIEALTKSFIELTSDNKNIQIDTAHDTWCRVLRLDVEVDKSVQEKEQIKEKCEDIINQLSGEDDNNVVHNMTLQFLIAVSDKAIPHPEHRLAAGLRHGL